VLRTHVLYDGAVLATVPAAMRTAVGLRDKGCRFPGCDRPLAWTDAHHIDHWADLGETAVPNLVHPRHADVAGSP
jgi:hypothetical protein